MIRRAYVDSLYGQLHYREATPVRATARPLVLLHQNPASSYEYEPLMAAIATDRRVIAFDTPGYGMSDGADRPLDMAECAAAFAAALAPLNIAECDVFGYHTGSLLAIELALAARAIVQNLAVSGLPMRDPADRTERLEAARNSPSIDEEGAVPLKMAQNLWTYVVASRTPGVPLDRAARNWVDKLRALDRSAWAYIGVWSYDYEARIPQVLQPTLLLQPHEVLLANSKAAAGLLLRHKIIELPQLERDVFDLPEAIEVLCTHMRAFFDASHAPPGDKA